MTTRQIQINQDKLICIIYTQNITQLNLALTASFDFIIYVLFLCVTYIMNINRNNLTVIVFFPGSTSSSFSSEPSPNPILGIKHFADDAKNHSGTCLPEGMVSQTDGG